jgi:Protein of unknown function (DUF2591)
MKTSELTGAALDWAVAKCEGLAVYFDDGVVCLKGQPFDDNEHYWLPTQNWAQGGPIIEREKIDVFWQSHQHAWVGSMSRGTNKIGFRHLQYGNSPLIAAMRCYVASKLGDEVEIPNELKGE